MSRSRAKDLFDAFVLHGEKWIDEMIAMQVSEELFLDYKRVSNDGKSPRLEETDRANYARAISGFGNAEGGLIVWGVECRQDRGDLPDKKFPITEPRRFVGALEGATSGCTLPPHDGVIHHLIESPASGTGFVVSFIPKSLKAPHQCIAKGKSHERYMMRAGSDFLPVPHGLLAGMFGRRPSPNIYGVWLLEGNMAPASYAPVIYDRPTSVPFVSVTLVIKNDGIVVAKDLFANFWSKVDKAGLDIRLDRASQKFEFHQSVTRWNMIAHPDFRLAPSSEIEVFTLSLYVLGHVSSPFEFEFVFGCSESQVHRASGTVPAGVVNAALDRFMNSDRGPAEARILGRTVFDSDRMAREYAGSFGR